MSRLNIMGTVPKQMDEQAHMENAGTGTMFVPSFKKEYATCPVMI